MGNTSGQTMPIISTLAVALSLFAIMKFGLTAALFSGIAVFVFSTWMGGKLKNGEIVAALVIGSIFSLAAWLGGSYINGTSTEKIVTMLLSIANKTQENLPQSLVDQLPQDIVVWLKSFLTDHASEAAGISAEFGTGIARMFVGMIIGWLLSWSTPVADSRFTRELFSLFTLLTNTFRNIIIGQGLVSALNTTLTGVFLLVVIPMFGFHVPYATLLVLLTFIVGLLPIVGNLISNTVITFTQDRSCQSSGPS
jgi:predicted PurR-regulated permease PerM